MSNRVFIAATGNGLTHATGDAAGQWHVERVRAGSDVRCLAADPLNPARVYAGTQGQGVLRSDDRGRTWQPVGLAGQSVKAIAASPTRPAVVYAGTKPAAMFVSHDGETTGLNWPHSGASPGAGCGSRRLSHRSLAMFRASPSHPPTRSVSSWVLRRARPS